MDEERPGEEGLENVKFCDLTEEIVSELMSRPYEGPSEAYKRRIAEAALDGEVLIPMEQASYYLDGVVSAHSQQQTQSARLCHLFLFGDEHGQIRFDESPTGENPLHLPPIESGKEFIDAMRQAVPSKFGDLRLRQVGFLCQGCIAHNLTENWRRQITAPGLSAVTSLTMGKYLRLKHGMGYEHLEGLVFDNLKEFHQDGRARELDGFHELIVSWVPWHVERLYLALQIHPIAYLQHMEDFMAYVKNSFEEYKLKTKRLYGVSTGAPRATLTYRHDQAFRAFCLRHRSARRTAKPISHGTIAERLGITETADPARTVRDLLRDATRELSWFQALQQPPLDDADAITAIYMLGEIPLDELRLSAEAIELEITVQPKSGVKK